MKKIIILIGKIFFKQYIWPWNLSQQNKYWKYYTTHESLNLSKDGSNGNEKR